MQFQTRTDGQAAVKAAVDTATGTPADRGSQPAAVKKPAPTFQPKIHDEALNTAVLNDYQRRDLTVDEQDNPRMAD